MLLVSISGDAIPESLLAIKACSCILPLPYRHLYYTMLFKDCQFFSYKILFFFFSRFKVLCPQPKTVMIVLDKFGSNVFNFTINCTLSSSDTKITVSSFLLDKKNIIGIINYGWYIRFNFFKYIVMIISTFGYMGFILLICYNDTFAFYIKYL